jgi:hypothetical protein
MDSKLKSMNMKKVEVKESPGVQLAKKMLESQQQMQKEATDNYNNPDSESRKRVDELIKRTDERSTPIVSENILKSKEGQDMKEEAVIESPGVKFAKALLESQRQTTKEALEEYQTNPEIKKLVDELKKRNAERGTPVVKL